MKTSHLGIRERTTVGIALSRARSDWTLSPTAYLGCYTDAMKKLAIGCGVVLLLAGVVTAGVGYYVYRQASSMFAQLRELDRLPEIERNVRVQTTYTPPASGELTVSQVERLVKVQESVRQRLGQRFADLDAKYKTLIDKKEATAADVPALLGAYRDMAAAWMEAKRSQVDGLNSVDMSLAEYKWIREQTYRALGVPYMDLDVSKIVEHIRSGRGNVEPAQIGGSIGPSGPESNRKIIEAYKKRLEENLALAAFGL